MDRVDSPAVVGLELLTGADRRADHDLAGLADERGLDKQEHVGLGSLLRGAPTSQPHDLPETGRAHESTTRSVRPVDRRGRNSVRSRSSSLALVLLFLTT